MVPARQLAQLPWSSTFLEDKRFQKIAVITLVLSLIIGVIIPFINLPEIKPPTPEELEKIYIKWKRPELSEAQKRALEEAKRKAELEKQRLEEEARRKAEEERKRREEEAKKRTEEERKRQEELEKQREEERKRAELERQKLDEEARKRAELERQRRAEEAKKQAELNRKRQEEEARRQAELEQQRREEQARRRAEEERQRREAEARRIAEEKAKGEQLAASLFGGLNSASDPSPSAATQATGLVSGKQAAAQAPTQGGSPDVLRSSTSVGQGSKGIDIGQLGNVGAGGGETLATRSTTQIAEVDLGVSEGGSNSASSTSGDDPYSRTRAELSAALDRYRAQMGKYYNRALVKNPILGEGKVVFKITILPTGKVSDVQVLSSDINDQSLLNRIMTLIRGIDFGAKDVATTVVNYPIDFRP